ncbi:hypothetical protein PFNF135_01300 [Plasmodium falciparum NF135/5.C10]|uniref:PUA domain-containing protein n=1 Tax=Plasmodium falciparum NF135/5.C10 TaxID=1036726 RepID=W4IKX6_PLAFA|nr:hypothetical protein PFNF135_01300 [Plasmodium falciparum NF135/5.C10]
MKSFSVENISSQNLMKSSVQRSIKATILKQYPKLEDHIENIFPKKGSLFLGKCINHKWTMDTKFKINPFMMPQIQVDKGAIKHVLRGSNIMCPGVTSPGGKLDDVEANTVVVSVE